MLWYLLLSLLNFINLLKKKERKIPFVNKGENIRAPRRDIPMSKEWYNSLYSFNKNSVKVLPVIYNNTFKLFKLYFNIVNNWMEKKSQSSKQKKIHRYSGKKLWISNPEIKYFNEKINITIYIYNKSYNFYKKKLEFFNFTWTTDIGTYLSDLRAGKFNNIKYYIKIVKWLKLNKYLSLIQYKSKIINTIKNDRNIDLDRSINLLKDKNYIYLINLFNKELIYMKFKQIMLFHQFKYNELYLSYIIKYIQKMYKKKVECNIITLKYYHLNTNILLQIIATKIKSPKHRGKHLLPIDYAMNKIKVPILSKNKLSGKQNFYLGVQNVKLKEYSLKDKNSLNNFLINNVKSKIWSDKNMDDLILSNLENKIIAGVFIKIAGRLTKRYKAQRAINNLRFKGTLKNAYSAHKNISSSLSRGYSNINIEKAKVNSTVRVGSFGLTGWIASY